MKRLLICGFALLALTACKTVPIAQSLEQADTTAASSYSVIATVLNAYEKTTNANVATAETYKKQAWFLFQQEHTLYLTGNASLATLQGLVGQIQTVQTAALALN